MKILEDEGHDTGDWKAACEEAMLWGDTIYTGFFLQKKQPSLDEVEPILEEGSPLVHRPIALSQAQAQAIIKRMMCFRFFVTSEVTGFGASVQYLPPY